MRTLRFLLSAILLPLLWLSATPADAQQPVQQQTFTPVTKTYVFSATSSAGTAVAIAALDPSNPPIGYVVENVGSADAWVMLSDSSGGAAVTIPSAGSPSRAQFIPAGTTLLLSGPSVAWFNAKTPSGATTINVIGGYGTIAGVTSSAASSGGIVTATQGSPNAGGALAWPVTGTVATTPATPSTTSQAITASQCATLSSLLAQGTVGAQITGTWTGTLTAYKSVDTSNFVSARMTFQPIGGGVSGTSVTTNGVYTIDSAGAESVKVCGNTVSSGTATVSLRTNTAAESSVDGFGILAGTTASRSAVVVTTQPAPYATSALSTTTLAGADATISAACATCSERIITNNSGATVYLALGTAAASGSGVQITNGATYFEDKYTGAIHAYGTGNVTVQAVTP